MSIQTISRRLAVAGVKHVVVSATSSSQQEDARLVTIKTQIMVKAIGDTNIEKAVRIANDISKLVSGIGDASSAYRVDALKAVSELSGYIKLYGSVLQDPAFARYEKMLSNPKATFSRTPTHKIYADLANIVLALGKHYTVFAPK